MDAATDGTQTRTWKGSARSPLDWQTLSSIFDDLFGSERRSLRRYPQSPDSISAEWRDDAGVQRELGCVDDLEQLYREQRTGRIVFGGHVAESHRAYFFYWPGGPRPRAEVTVTGPPTVVDAMIETAKMVFPLPYDGALIFLSWGGDGAAFAGALHRILSPRFPMAEVFLSTVSIEPGDDPMRSVLEDGLLRAQILIAVLTKESMSRPWVIWETAAAWAREVLVIPIFVDVEPSAVSGPLTHKVQGVHLMDRSGMDRAIVRVGSRLEMGDSASLTDLEYQELTSGLSGSS